MVVVTEMMIRITEEVRGTEIVTMNMIIFVI